jgi:integrase
VFLGATAKHRFGLLYRLVLLAGLRRGEACGLRWEDLEEIDGRWYITIRQTVLQLHGEVFFDTPKSAAGERVVSIDADTAEQLKTRRKIQRRERLAAGVAWQEHGLIFTYEDGRPLSPDWVSTTFKAESRSAGLPVIRLHDGRHTAATLGLEAGLDIKVVSARLGHSTTRITQDLYTHVRRVVADAAADKVVELLPKKDKKGSETGT